MTLKITGAIVNNDDKWIYDLFDYDSFCPNDLYDYLENVEDGQDLDIEINSRGGYVFAGSEIYTALINHKGPVNVTITGVAASMASVIAMAGTTVSMSPTAQMMIHNASGTGSGDYRDFEHFSKQLKTTNEAIVNAYILKTGKTKAELFAMMDKETWMSAKDARDNNFADQIKKYEIIEILEAKGLEYNAKASKEELYKLIAGD